MKAIRSFFQNALDRPRSLRLRKLVFDVHLYAGLLVGVFVLVVGVSGSAIVFEPEMTRALNSDITLVERTPGRASLQSIIDTLKKKQPGIRLFRIYLPNLANLAASANSTDEAYEI
ncbi:MAG: PepSY domain-containing protein, partial [Pyrinomonadaceae bacterium]